MEPFFSLGLAPHVMMYDANMGLASTTCCAALRPMTQCCPQYTPCSCLAAHTLRPSLADLASNSCILRQMQPGTLLRLDESGGTAGGRPSSSAARRHSDTVPIVRSRIVYCRYEYVRTSTLGTKVPTYLPTDLASPGRGNAAVETDTLCFALSVHS